MFVRHTIKLVLIAILTTMLGACGEQPAKPGAYATVPVSASNPATSAGETPVVPGPSATAASPTTNTTTTLLSPSAVDTTKPSSATSASTTQANAASAHPFPLRVSDDKRHLAYADGTPFFYMADTGWRLTTELTHSDVDQYLDDRKAKGFTVIQVMLLPIIHLSNKNVYGEYPFTDGDHFDLTKPNEAFFQNVDWIFTRAAEKGMVLLVNPAWFGQGQDNWWKYLTTSNAQQYGQYLGNRYKNYNNLMWFLGGDYKPDGKFTEIKLLAETLKQIAPQQLMSYHAGPEAASSSKYFQNEAWLDFNICYTYQGPYDYVLADYNKTPRKPVIFGEGGYENESNDAQPGTPHRIRRQAYWTMLYGAAGQAYGGRDIWMFAPGWQSALQWTGAQDMVYVRNLLTGVDWSSLVPDQQHSYLTGGYGSIYEDFVSVSYTPAGKLLLAYTPQKATLKVNLAKFSARVTARWFDPTNGKYQLIAENLDNQGEREFTSPDKNSGGDADFVLVIQTVAATGVTGINGFADPAYQAVWNRTDQPVASGTVSRSYLWGPAPNTAGLFEAYAEAPGGRRQVQYFDKSRMEITYPQSDKTSPYYVTTGLMAYELITGEMKLGDNQFEAISPAEIGVAGDIDDTGGPTYKTLRNLLGPVANATGSFARGSVDRAGNIRLDAEGLSRQYQADYRYYEPLTKHNIAAPFWTFLNQVGPVLNPANQLVQSRLFDPLFYVTGLPITEAWWARVKVAGKVQDVLIQAFERRVLTFTPSNPQAFQVEMGNIGLHYYDWRYNT